MFYIQVIEIMPELLYYTELYTHTCKADFKLPNGFIDSVVSGSRKITNSFGMSLLQEAIRTLIP